MDSVSLPPLADTKHETARIIAAALRETQEARDELATVNDKTPNPVAEAKLERWLLSVADVQRKYLACREWTIEQIAGSITEEVFGGSTNEE